MGILTHALEVAFEDARRDYAVEELRRLLAVAQLPVEFAGCIAESTRTLTSRL